MIAILIPVLGRPHRVEPLLASIAAATPEPHDVVWLTDPEDREQRAAIRLAGGTDLAVGGVRYSRKINRGVRETDTPFVFLAADDLDFQPGWVPAALAAITDGGAQVVGVNDLIDRPRRPMHATHFLLTREYAGTPTIDGKRGPLCEGYAHWFVDDELIATAEHRGTYTYAPDAHVRHLHPMVGAAEDDETYRRGRARARADRRLFHSRRHLWT